MTDFDETQYPRSTDGTFAQKANTEPETALTPGDGSPSRVAFLAAAEAWAAGFKTSEVDAADKVRGNLPEGVASVEMEWRHRATSLRSSATRPQMAASSTTKGSPPTSAMTTTGVDCPNLA